MKHLPRFFAPLRYSQNDNSYLDSATPNHQGNLADFIVTKAALHHLPDFWKMVALLRMNSMLKEGGILCLRDAVFSFEANQYHDSINAWIERVSKPVGEGFTAEDFATHVREEYSTFSWIIEGMLTRAGFEIASANYPTPEYAQYVCRKISTTAQQLPSLNSDHVKIHLNSENCVGKVI